MYRLEPAAPSVSESKVDSPPPPARDLAVPWLFLVSAAEELMMSLRWASGPLAALLGFSMLVEAHSDVSGRESAVTVRMLEPIARVWFVNLRIAKRAAGGVKGQYTRVS